MSLAKTLVPTAALLACLLGCGPDKVAVDTSWAIGSYSSEIDGSPAPYLTNVEVSEDGTVTFATWSGCKGSDSIEESTYNWVADGPDAIRITHPDGELIDGQLELWLTKTQECDQFMLRSRDRQGISDFLFLFSGATCLVDIGPCEEGVECDDCAAKWCDGPPPACQ